MLTRRKFEYRIFNKDTKSMEYFDLITLSQFLNKFDDSYINKNFVVMQFTGLTDCKEVDIYEGDILKHQFRGAGQVIYEAPGYRVVNDDNDIWLGHAAKKHRRVIGNIYEHPKLVKK